MSLSHDISFNIIKDAYLTQAWVHNLLSEEYAKHGLKYYGRSRYLEFDEKTMHYDPNYGNVINGYGVNIVNTQFSNSGSQLGVAGLYKKLTELERQIHKEVLKNVFNSFNTVTNKHITEKFNIMDFGKSLGKDDFSKIIKASKELVYDLKEGKEWLKSVENILKRIDLKYRGKIKNTKHLLTMQSLEQLGIAILGRAIELCPIETGFLRTSGTVYTFNNYIRIIFECPYATYVHENVNAVHPFGQAKFLETAAQEILPNISVWAEQTGNSSMTYGKYMKLEWEHDSSGKATGDPKWVEKIGYSAVYIDIDVDLNINYVHHG